MSAEELTQRRAELLELLIPLLTEDQLKEASKRIAAFTAAAVRLERARLERAARDAARKELVDSRVNQFFESIFRRRQEHGPIS